MTTRIGLLVFAAAALFVSAGATASARPPAGLSCGQVLTANAVLTQNLRCSGTALVIGADGVTLDLAGHTLRGDGSGFGVMVQANHAVVRDGAIREFGTGVRSGSFIDDVRLDSLKVTDSGSGVIFDLVTNSEISNSTVADNSGDGVDDTGGANIHDNVIKHNGHYGVMTAPGVCCLTTIQDNKINRNGLGGVLNALHGAAIIGNKIRRNGGNGITFSDIAPGGGTIANNVANRNDQLGISVCIDDQHGHDCTLGAVVDGGGNSARNNGDPRQCVNIVCTRRPTS